MKKIALITLSALALFSGCNRQYDTPPLRTIPEGNILTIQQAKDMYFAKGAGFTFTDDYSIYCVATTDESTGNFYKQIYVQDTSGAIELLLTNSGGVYKGDSIRLALKGTYISMYKGMMQIDSVSPDNNIIKQATGVSITPLVTTIDQLDPVNDQGKWIQINDVEFSGNDLGSSWANAVTQASVNHNLVDCNGNTVLVRTSGYANFASDTIPSGHGTFYGILGIYNTDIQLYIQSPTDLTLNDPNRCTGGPALLSKDFEDGSITSGGWTTQLVTGTLDWSLGTIGGSYAKMSNYNGTANENNETWLISPPVDLTNATAPGFDFKSAYKYTGPAMQVFVTNNFSGDVTTTTWTPVPFTLPATADFTFYTSGVTNFTSFVGSTIRVAFQYTGSTTQGSTWEVDDIAIKEY